MKKLGLIIDSTTIIPQELMEKYDIRVVSLNVVMAGETRREVDMKDSDVVDHLEDVKDIKSSSPAPQDFIVAYNQLFADGYESILVFTLSRNCSGTYQTAVIAKDSLDDQRLASKIYIVDTLMCNYGVASALLTTLPLFDQDLDAKTIYEMAEERCRNTRIMFTIVDLKHLFRGGRLNKLSCALGLLFKIKPVIIMEDGRLKLAHKERTFNGVLDIFIKEAAVFASNFKHLAVRIINLNNEAIAKQLNDRLVSTFKNIEITYIDRVGPVFNVHLGNDGVGIGFTAYND